MLDKNFLGDIYVKIFVLYNPGKTLPPEVLELATHAYYRHLSSLTNEQLQDAVERAIAYEAFMPTAETLLGFATGSVKVRALRQWSIAAQEATNPRKLNETNLDEPAKKAIQTLGGLYELGRIDNNWERQRIEAQFIELYTEASRTPDAFNPVPTLPSAKKPKEFPPYNPKAQVMASSCAVKSFPEPQKKKPPQNFGETLDQLESIESGV
ncbi:MAG: hypothetical protein F6J87_14730 [Spirulina sp. SIO3F2]|nr:hypothetical protein [Spirulina sp. SIO3F2]